MSFLFGGKYIILWVAPNQDLFVVGWGAKKPAEEPPKPKQPEPVKEQPKPEVNTSQTI